MTTLYVDNIAPNLQSKISAPNLQLPSGSVIQVIGGDYSTVVTSTSATFATTNLSASITPLNTLNNVLVSFSMPVSINRSGNAFVNMLRLQVKRGDTAIEEITPSTGSGLGAIFNSRDNDPSTSGTQVIINYQFIDVPNTTSEITYSIEMACRGGLGAVYAHTIDGSTASKSTITLMEIAG